MSIHNLQERYAEFISKRNWEKFHQPKNIAMSISVESAELMELFQWKDNVPIEKIKEDKELMERVREELADVVLYSLSMAQRLDIDIEQAVLEKLEENEERFNEERTKELTEEFEKWQKD